jgi:hypothetical protein
MLSCLRSAGASLRVSLGTARQTRPQTPSLPVLASLFSSTPSRYPRSHTTPDVFQPFVPASITGPSRLRARITSYVAFQPPPPLHTGKMRLVPKGHHSTRISSSPSFTTSWQDIVLLEKTHGSCTLLATSRPQSSMGNELQRQCVTDAVFPQWCRNLTLSLPSIVSQICS